VQQKNIDFPSKKEYRAFRACFPENRPETGFAKIKSKDMSS